MNSDLIYQINDYSWSIYLPVLLVLGTYVNFMVLKNRNKWDNTNSVPLTFAKVKGSLSISLGSKIGTGAIIGVLAAMWQGSNQGSSSGLGIIVWTLLSMLVLVPISYSEVFLTQITKLTPRQFINKKLNPKLGTIYGLGLVMLYCFGFVGFQLTGIQTVIRFVSNQYFQIQFSTTTTLAFIIVPILVITAIIILSRNHQFFINILSFVIFFVIVSYILFFLAFLFLTADFIPVYFDQIINSVTDLQSASTGILVGLIIASQRIIQISETSLGTSALASFNSKNTPRQESLIQTLATLISIGLAVIITSYIYAYGLETFDNITIADNTFDRLIGFLSTIYSVTGYAGLFIIVCFFILSGFSTILGSFHFLDSTLNLSEWNRIYIYLILIFISGTLSVFDFNLVFEATNILMFIVGLINIFALSVAIYKKNKVN